MEPEALPEKQERPDRLVTRARAPFRAGRKECPAGKDIADPASPPDKAASAEDKMSLENAEPADDGGLATLEDAVRARPDDARAWYLLGCALNRANRPGEALQSLNNAVTLAPDHVDAVCELGMALLALRSLAEAGDAFEEVLATHPLHGSALFCLGAVRYRQGRFAEAAALWRRAADVSRDPIDALENLAVACQHLQLPDQECIVWREILVRCPDQPVALHKLAALGEGPAPLRASDACVARLFDAFACEFDSTLQALGYRGPELVANLVREVVGEPAAALDVLDAGCGTGLCGAWLRPWARRLVGIDLSSGMLAKARARDQYDELVQTEVSAYLAAHPAVFDVIVSCDTLNYSGALEQVTAAAGRALRPAGSLVFTLETLATPRHSAGYRLETSGRYSHTGDYIRCVIDQAGLRIEDMRTETLRLESGQPVTAWLVVARLK
jgi:predicted TPR repeat methyltransferase